MAAYTSPETSFFGGYEPRTYEEEGAARELAPGDSGAGMDTWRYGSPTNLRNWRTIQSQGSGGGGGRSSGPQPSGSVTTSSTTFAGEAPSAPKIPKLELPKFDKRAVRALTQKLAAPGMRRLSEGLQTALTVQSENPNVRRMTLREALQGYGTGLEQTLSGAGQQARGEHMQELEQQGREAQMNWQAQTQAAMQAYNNAFQKYLASATRTQTTTPTYSGTGAPAGPTTGVGAIAGSDPGRTRSNAFQQMWGNLAPAYSQT
jgi:hypothetical protein